MLSPAGIEALNQPLAGRLQDGEAHGLRLGDAGGRATHGRALATRGDAAGVEQEPDGAGVAGLTDQITDIGAQIGKLGRQTFASD